MAQEGAEAEYADMTMAFSFSNKGCCGKLKDDVEVSGNITAGSSCGHDPRYCQQYALSHWMVHSCPECCEGMAGCRDAHALLVSLGHAQDVVFADLVLAVCNIIFVLLVDGAALRPLRRIQARFWTQGHLLLSLFSLADGIMSAYVMDYLMDKRVSDLLDSLYSFECFSRMNDRVIFEASGVLTSYIEIIVPVQVGIAFLTAAFHFVKAFRKEDMEGVTSLTAMEGMLELSELLTSIAGFIQFTAAAESFHKMHNLMDADRYTQSQMQSLSDACIYSCCTGIERFEPPPSVAAWEEANLSDSLVLAGCILTMVGLVGLCGMTYRFTKKAPEGDILESAASVENPIQNSEGREKSASRIALEAELEEVRHSEERLKVELDEAREKLSDWQQHVDPVSGADYFHNKVTGETTYEDPEACFVQSNPQHSRKQNQAPAGDQPARTEGNANKPEKRGRRMGLVRASVATFALYRRNQKAPEAEAESSEAKQQQQAKALRQQMSYFKRPSMRKAVRRSARPQSAKASAGEGLADLRRTSNTADEVAPQNPLVAELKLAVGNNRRAEV